MLSQSVQQTLRQLQKDEHKARVAELIRRNAIFYRRQKLCETIFSSSILVSFSIFSCYMVLSYGFEYFCTPNFQLETSTPSQSRRVGDEVTLLCSTTHPWEWCRWVHMAQFCEWEWKSSEEGTVVTGCTMHGVEMVGNYSQHQCGIRIAKLRPKDRGVWLCEIEKYHAGFSRRYGEVRYGQMSLGVVRSPHYSPPPPTTTTTTTTQLNHVEVTTESQQQIDEEAARVEEEKIYQRNFLILRVVVRTSVAITLVTLSSGFVALFLHTWRQWELNAREKAEALAAKESEDEDDDDYSYDEIDPMLKRKLLQTRRKSVAFSVCVVDRDNMTFDLDRKKVLLGVSSDRLSTLPSLAEQQSESETTENVKFNVPILQGAVGSRRGSRVATYHQRTGRRMSVPAVPLGGLGLIQEVRFGNSIETII